MSDVAPQPQFTIAKPAGGILPISAVHTAPNAPQSNGGVRKNQQPAPQPSKLVVRRLAPGLTEDEFEAALGSDWNLGQGKLAWKLYKPGKVSKDLSKPSKPSRAYLQVTQQSYLDPLAQRVREASFADVRKTDNDPVLLGPPVLEFAPYTRLANGRKRNDTRQGSIDQDHEFIQFLESLTNPIVKGHALDGAESTLRSKDDTPKVTPLIQHLRDKKAAKEAAKEKEKTTPAKGGKHGRQGSKNGKVEAGSAAEPSQRTQANAVSPDRKNARPGKAERVTKASGKQGKKDFTNTDTVAPGAAPPSSPKQAPSTPNKRAEAATPVSAAARMLQRDLGIRGGRGASIRRGGRQGPLNAGVDGSVNATTNATTTTTTTATPVTQQPQTAEAISGGQTPTPLTISQQAETNTVLLKSDVPLTSNQPRGGTTPNIPPAVNPKILPKPTPGSTPTRAQRPPINPLSTQAFLKHANPSQGITEALLEEAFKPFGAISKVEIDKRKGFAYIDFVEPDGLRKAMAASPIKVAQGNVQVLEKRERVVAPIAAAGRGAPIPINPRGGTANVGVGYRGGRAMRGGGRGGVVRGVTSNQPGAPAMLINKTSVDALPSNIPTGPRSSTPAATVAASSGQATSTPPINDGVPTGPRQASPVNNVT